jgi:SAM-dependent methyltransferase
MSVLQKFRDWNVALSQATTPDVLFKLRGFALYDLLARAELGKPENKVVLDVGGGRTWQFGETYHNKPGFELIGIDISGAELALNPHLHRAIESDICRSLGLKGKQVDLILSRATLEHLHDTGAFLRNAYGALRPGGCVILLFAGKWALSTVLNRIIPEKLAVKLLHALVPNSKGYQGFEAHYDNCSYSGFRKSILETGFIIRDFYPNYYNSSYFQFFFPLHFISICHDMLRQMLSIKALSSMNLFVIEKPA